MPSRNGRLLITFGVGLAVMAFTGWAILRRPSAASATGGPYRFMHCPACGREVPYSADLLEKGCRACGPQQQLIPTTTAKAAGVSAAGAYGRLVGPLLVEANILLGVLLYLAVSQKRQKQEQEEEFLYIACARCHQRLRYAMARVGHAGQCPRCKTGLVFPPPEEEEEPPPWWQPKRWVKVIRERSWLPAARGRPGAEGGEEE